MYIENFVFIFIYIKHELSQSPHMLDNVFFKYVYQVIIIHHTSIKLNFFLLFNTTNYIVYVFIFMFRRCSKMSKDITISKI